MTDHSDLISQHNLTYVTYSGRADQTAHTRIEIVKIYTLQQLVMLLLENKKLKNLNFWQLSSQAKWMTGNSHQISRHNWIHVTYSGRGDQTADDSCKTIKISHLVKLLMPQLNSQNLENFNYWQLSDRQGESLAIATKFVVTIEYMLHILVEGMKLQTTVVKLSRYLIWWSC